MRRRVSADQAVDEDALVLLNLIDHNDRVVGMHHIISSSSIWTLGSFVLALRKAAHRCFDKEVGRNHRDGAQAPQKQSVDELLPPNLYALQVNPGLGLNVGSWTMG